MILQEDEIKYIFNPYILLPGDILLMNTYEEKLRKMMGCKYEHAAIYLGDAFIMEANGLHVRMTHIYSYAFKELAHAVVLRLKNSSQIIIDRIVRASHYQMGKQYVHTSQFRNIRKFKKTREQDSTNRYFCSRLVAQSYAQEGVELLPNADYCEPDDFLNSSLLEPVKDAVIPFLPEMAKVVMFQQKGREQYEADSPSTDLFEALSKLYETDIQELGQVFTASFSQPEKDDDAIELIKVSRMFKHLDDVKSNMPWIWKDEEFFEHYDNTEDELHFLYCQMNHYDSTIIPRYKELHLQMIFAAHYNSESSLLAFMKDYVRKMVDEAVICRKRMAKLYVATFHHDEVGFIVFIDKYGFYSGFKYTDTPTDIGYLLHDVMKATSNSNKKC